jgi:hypothetical protein
VGDVRLSLSDYMIRRSTDGLLILKRGEVALERYGIGSGPESRGKSWCVATLGNGLEETASHHGASSGDTRRFQYRLRPCHDVRRSNRMP